MSFVRQVSLLYASGGWMPCLISEHGCFHFTSLSVQQIWWGKTHHPTPLIKCSQCEFIVVYYVVNVVAQCSIVVTFIVKRLDTISHSQKCPFKRFFWKNSKCCCSKFSIRSSNHIQVPSSFKYSIDYSWRILIPLTSNDNVTLTLTSCWCICKQCVGGNELALKAHQHQPFVLENGVTDFSLSVSLIVVLFKATAIAVIET